MVKSMTGYGRSEFSVDGETYAVEAKSLNGRFVEMKVRLPERFFHLETRVRDEVKKRFSRGTFSVYVTLVSAEAPSIKLNMDAARAYLSAAEELKHTLGVKGEVDLNFLLRQKEIFLSGRKIEGDSDWAPLKAGLDSALDGLDAWRKDEGKALFSDLTAKLAEIESYIASVEGLVQAVVEAYRKGLYDRMAELLEGRVDESRILMEAALFAERSDVGEETVRLRSHLDMFRNYLSQSEPVGKRLDFLCQEILRETNTIASKAEDLRITQTVVEIKGVLERIREQVQNVE